MLMSDNLVKEIKMKKLTIITLVLMLAIGASAQVPKPFTIYLDGGLSMPNGDISAAYKNGWNFGAGVGFNMAPMFQIVPHIEYHSFSVDSPVDIGGKWTVWMMGADGRMSLNMPAAPIKPFFVGGLGFAAGKTEAIQLLGVSISDDVTQTKFYWNIGAGVDFNSFFLQVKYVSIATEGSSTNYIPVKVGLKF